MIRWSRALEPSMDLCSLPSPYRILQSVAGMAFNFSKMEIVPRAAQINKPTPPQAHPVLAASVYVESR